MHLDWSILDDDDESAPIRFGHIEAMGRAYIAENLPTTKQPNEAERTTLAKREKERIDKAVYRAKQNGATGDNDSIRAQVIANMKPRNADFMKPGPPAKRRRHGKQTACETDGCKKQPSFNVPGERVGRFCKEHKTPEMIDVKSRRCEREGCGTINPLFNVPGSERGRFCKEHRTPEMVDVISKRCETNGCPKRPNFNVLGESRGRFCKEHKDPGMIDIKHRKCEADGCTKIPSFNIPTEKRGRVCGEHADLGMINVMSPRCQHDGCTKHPSFNVPGTRRGRFCKEHKTPDMVDVQNRRCERSGCGLLTPAFNFPGSKRGRFCKKHIEPGMIDVISPRCKQAGCESINPIFNVLGEKRGRFCKEHMMETGMVNVTHRTCEMDGCSKQPNFNVSGERGGRFCKDHKDAGMINVTHRTCDYVGCTKQPTRGVPGHRTSRCVEHREAGMIMNPLVKCMETGCKEPAIYGHSKALHCTIHKTATEHNFIGKTCINCGLIDVVDADGRCNDCNPTAFKRARLAKQREVRDMLISGGHNDFSYDRTIDGGDCGKERPDFMWDCDTHMLVVENDEWQHKDRLEWCECSRMVNISQSAGLPVVFIRYNPDPYSTEGVTHNPTPNTRRKALLAWVSHLKNTPPEYFIGLVQLFFDGFKESDVRTECLTPLHRYEKRKREAEDDEK